MGQVCTRDDNVDKADGNAQPHLGDQGKHDGDKMKAAISTNTQQQGYQSNGQNQTQPPAPQTQHQPYQSQQPPKEVSKIGTSQIEDLHIDAKNLRPTNKMHLVNQTVQRKLDSMKQLRVDDFPALRQKYSSVPQSSQIVKDIITDSTYQGQLLRGVPHGFGRLVMGNGSIIEGFFEEGQPIGYVRKIMSNGAGYEGEFRNHFANGKGTQVEPNGNVIECSSWVDGQATGQTTIRGPTGQIIFQGSLDKGKKTGKCTFYDPTQQAVFSGEFKDDFLEGRGNKRYDNGQIYEGDFKRGIEEGRGVLTLVDGRKFDGPFVKGKANGEGTFHTDNGKPIKQTWKDGKRA